MQKRLRSEKLKFEESMQVGTLRKGKIERNTMQLFSDRLDLSTRSYAECAQKVHYFCQFFGILTVETRLKVIFDATNLCGSIKLTKYWIP